MSELGNGNNLGVGLASTPEQSFKLIASCYQSCIRVFQRLNNELHTARTTALMSTEQLQRTQMSLCEQFERFKLWAGNAGAHRSGRMSLDYRMREALHIHSQVVQLLEDMEHALEEALKIITNTAYLSNLPEDQESTIGSSGYDSLLPSDSDDSLPECNADDALFDEEQLPSTSELEYAMLDIDHVLKCLYRFSTVLYQAVPANRIHKCASIDVTHYELWDIQHAINKFPHAPEGLQKRLGRANTKRRQLLIYNKRHHKKISQFIGAAPALELLEPVETTQKDELEGAQSNTAPDRENKRGPGTVLSGTTATTFHAKNKAALKLDPLREELDKDSDTGTTQSQTSYASSCASHHGYRLSVPDPPHAKEDGFDDEPFLCPYCHDMVCIKNSKSWKHHVFSDIMPYVCTFTSCLRPEHLYGSRAEWFEHELRTHRREWHCEACNLTFGCKDNIIKHMGDSHKEEFPESEYLAVADWSERAQSSKQACPLCPPNFYPTREHLKQFHRNDIAGSVDISAKAEQLLNQDTPSCPYCPIKYEMAQLRRHLGYHLQQMALFTLPRPAEDELFTGEDEHESEMAYRGDFESGSQSELSSNIGIMAEERDVKYCLKKMLEFVEVQGLKRILGETLTDKQLQQLLLPQAEIAAKLPKTSNYVTRELTVILAILSLYDLAVLIDDSMSMEFEEYGKRKVAVKNVLAFIADIYGAVSDMKRGIRAIRFLNGKDDLDADNIMTAAEIDKVIDNHEFQGLTRIGTGLMQRILKPFVFDQTVPWNKKSGEARKLKQLGRPLLIMVITDGAVRPHASCLTHALTRNPLRGSKESPLPASGRQSRVSLIPLRGIILIPRRLKVCATIRKIELLIRATNAWKAIAFQFARVGNDRDAKKFLEHLGNKSSVKDYVDIVSGDIRGIIGMRTEDQALTEKHQRRQITV
ncbi:hypothetical protein L211DRAFT_680078 [Terfezia boudieri ATCC MYA-4762]|uniref:C2H2-type domain-containing protein n=1 Tax=Terfezia boudieri ATCC MYA-4762 TaxID=1051890 RepID=A0A3N4LXQ7_9PEZI|nr:hypothetical protein L211DRAFT_680078 [Terfezia boudieri ATCC MYA-4762]